MAAAPQTIPSHSPLTLSIHCHGCHMTRAIKRSLYAHRLSLPAQLFPLVISFSLSCPAKNPNHEYLDPSDFVEMVRASKPTSGDVLYFVVDVNCSPAAVAPKSSRGALVPLLLDDQGLAVPVHAEDSVYLRPFVRKDGW